MGGRNCYPIETKGKSRQRMDVTSSGTVSPIIGFMIGISVYLLPSVLSAFMSSKIYYLSVSMNI